MAPRPDPNPRSYSGRDKVDGTPYYKNRKVQPGFPGAPDTRTRKRVPVKGTPYYKDIDPVPGTPYYKNAPGPSDVKRKGLGQALQNTSKKYGNWGRPV
jgi:hypothetical protein